MDQLSLQSKRGKTQCWTSLPTCSMGRLGQVIDVQAAFQLVLPPFLPCSTAAAWSEPNPCSEVVRAS